MIYVYYFTNINTRRQKNETAIRSFNSGNCRFVVIKKM